MMKSECVKKILNMVFTEESDGRYPQNKDLPDF